MAMKNGIKIVFSFILLNEIRHEISITIILLGKVNYKMPVPSQEYDSCFPFVWCVLLFDFAI